MKQRDKQSPFEQMMVSLVLTLATAVPMGLLTKSLEYSPYLVLGVTVSVSLVIAVAIWLRSPNPSLTVPALVVVLGATAGVASPWTISQLQASAPAQAALDKAVPKVLEAPDILVVESGKTVTLRVIVRDGHSNLLPDQEVFFRTSPAGLGTYSEGRFTAGSVAQSGTLTLRVGELVHDVAIQVTSTTQVTSTVQDKPAAQVTPTAQVTPSPAAQQVATNQPTMSATPSPQTPGGTATVADKPVTPTPVDTPPKAPVPTTIETWADMVIAAGGGMDVPVIVRDQYGNEMSGVEVSAVSDVGQFADGIFSASTLAPRYGVIVFTAGDANLTVDVEVVPGAAARLDLTPFAYTATPGETFKLTGRLLDAHGNEISDAAMTCFAAAHGLGTYADGRFTAGTRVQSGTVECRAGEISATMFLEIRPLQP